MKFTRRSAISMLAVAPTALRSLAATSPSPSRLIISTYTDPVGHTQGAKGIYTCSWNAKDGSLGELELIAATPDPSFLIVSPKHPGILFAVNEVPGEHTNGSVSSFSGLPSHFPLKQLSMQDSGGAAPCHLAIDETGRALFVANYFGGSVSSFKVDSKGNLSKQVSLIQFTGHSIDPVRQPIPHAHCVVFSPDNRFLLVNDLGVDRIHVFHVDAAAATLTPAATPYYTAIPGSGPRHCHFHPNGRWLYSANELNSSIDVLDWNSADGSMTRKAHVSSLPPSALKERNNPAEIAIDAAGKFLYISNRFHDSIGVFAIDQSNGMLTPVEDAPCGGKNPRFFIIDPTGKWLLVAHQDSRSIVIFARDHVTGKLTPTGHSAILDAPVCILFA